MTPSIFNGRIPIDIRQETKAESVVVILGIGEAVNKDTRLARVKGLTDPIV